MEAEENGIQSDGSFQQDEFCLLPNGAVGVLVSLNKLRPRHESIEVQQSSHGSPYYPNKPFTVEKCPRRCEKGLNDAKNLINSLQTSLTEEQAAHEETKTLLVSILNELDEKERDFISSEEISDEFEKELRIKEHKALAEEKEAHEETKRLLVETQFKLSMEKLSDEYEKELTMERQICKELEQKSDEFKRELTCEREARKKAEDQLQKSEQISKELKTTLATAQNSLKTRLESEKQCDWMLRREEIQLTEEKLGSGSFGTVYKGMFRDTEVAVKSAHPQITIQNKKDFRREIRMAAMCQHPCMLQFIGATSDDQSPLLVTELLDTSLKNVLKTLRPIEIINIALDVAKGLNYLHLNYPNPIVHRDISSGNVLLKKHGESWQGKVSDYGNAVLMNYAKTGSGGAVPYLAPEMGSQKFSTKSDVYSYGVLLLEMCLKELPSFLDDKDELVCLVKNQEMRSLIRSCIHQNSTQRPSMQEIIVVLKKLVF